MERMNEQKLIYNIFYNATHFDFLETGIRFMFRISKHRSVYKSFAH